MTERVWIDRGGTSAPWREVSTLHPSTDGIVVKRARMNADAPYDPQTCTNYPWAAAARIKVLEDELRWTRRAEMVMDTVSGAAIPSTKTVDTIHAMADTLRQMGIDPHDIAIPLPYQGWCDLREAISKELPGFTHAVPNRLGEFMFDGLRFVCELPKPEPIGMWIADIERARAQLGPHNPAREALLWAERGLEKSRDSVDFGFIPSRSDKVWQPQVCAMRPHECAGHIAWLEAKLARIEAALNSSDQEQNQHNDKNDAKDS